MKNKNMWLRLLGTVSVAMLLYCLIAYIHLHIELSAALPISKSTELIGIFVIPALAIVGVYHIVLLVNALRSVTGKLISAVYIVMIAISGITIFSDLTILSEIGKEYMLWDVTDQWIIIYGFTALHIFVVIWGLFRIKSSVISLSSNDRFFLSMHHIGLISGPLGLAGVIIANSGLLAPMRYAAFVTVLLAGLAIFPLLIITVYWIMKLRRIKIQEWLDEKQLTDSAIGALVSLVVSIPVYVLICVLDLFRLSLSASSWMLGLFFVQLSVFSVVLTLRNRQAE